MEQNETTTEELNKKTDNNKLMGLVAIFISVLSMIAVIYQSYLAREENTLTRVQQSAAVLPYLNFSYSNVGNEYKFVIKNKGVGPAFIKSVEFTGMDINNKDSLFFNSSHQFHHFLTQKSTFIDSVPVTKSSFHANMLLSPNEGKEFFIFSFIDENQKRQFGNQYYKYFRRLKIVYEDIYGSQWILNSDKGYPEKLKKE